LPAQPGGGLWNTAKALAALRQAHNLDFSLAAVPAVQLSDQLATAFERLGVALHDVGSAELAENLVFSHPWARTDRSILRDPVRGAGVNDRAGSLLLPTDSLDDGILVLNSVKCPRLFAALIERALVRGVAQVVVLTGSPSWPQLFKAIRQPNNAAVFGDWSEWSTLLTEAGLPHELGHRSESELSSVGALADLPARVRLLGVYGDVICTLGENGLIIGDAATQTTWWVGLVDGPVWEHVQQQVQNYPETRSGMGDSLVGCWVGERWGNDKMATPWPPAVAAAVRATRDLLVLRGLMPPESDGVTATQLDGVRLRSSVRALAIAK
jgi:hypothetical protein